jgi:molybdenum cofactor synthesis domain-containing protein
MKQATILHVCLSETRATPKSAVDHAVLREGHGLEGDAHAGAWHRQVSLLDHADIETVRAQSLEIESGAFGENLVISGLALDALGIGSRLRLGEAELEITQIGKVCHNRCAIYERTGDCIMPRAGIFARVVTGGEITPGMSVEVTAQVSRRVIQAAVLTVSDRCACGETKDTAGPAVAVVLERQLEARVAWTGLVPDDQDRISETLKDVADRGLDLLLTVGGTGCGPRDVTPEATRAVINREVPGIAEAMRAASARITPHALLQRGICGVCGSTLIINLPGSENAAVENLAIALPVLPHAVRLLRGDTAHPEKEIRKESADRAARRRRR